MASSKPFSPPPKDILNLDHLLGKRVRVKFQGGREGEFPSPSVIDSVASNPSMRQWREF